MTNDLSIPEVRQALAIRRGYWSLSKYGRWTCLNSTPDWTTEQWDRFWTSIRTHATESEAWDREVPNFTGDSRVAYELCLELASKNRFDLLVLESWRRPKGTYFARFVRLADENERPAIARGEGFTPSEALARLALAYYEILDKKNHDVVRDAEFEANLD